MKRLRLLIADDHTVLRETLREFLSRQPDMEVVGEAADGVEAVRLAKQHRPDIVLMDLSMPHGGGVEAVGQLQQINPGLRVVVLTAHESPLWFNQMRQAGVAGYVLKHSTTERLIEAIRQVAQGGVYFEPQLLAQMDGRPSTGRSQADRTVVTELSHREAQVLHLIALGYTAKEAAAKLNVSTKSVETYKARLMEKLALASRVELVHYAQAHGLAQPE